MSELPRQEEERLIIKLKEILKLDYSEDIKRSAKSLVRLLTAKYFAKPQPTTNDSIG